MEVREGTDLRDNMEAESAGCVAKLDVGMWGQKRGKSKAQKSVMDSRMLFTELGTQKGKQISGKDEFWWTKFEVNMPVGAGRQYTIVFITKQASLI